MDYDLWLLQEVALKAPGALNAKLEYLSMLISEQEELLVECYENCIRMHVCAQVHPHGAEASEDAFRCLLNQSRVEHIAHLQQAACECTCQIFLHTLTWHTLESGLAIMHGMRSCLHPPWWGLATTYLCFRWLLHIVLSTESPLNQRATRTTAQLFRGYRYDTKPIRTLRDFKAGCLEHRQLTSSLRDLQTKPYRSSPAAVYALAVGGIG